MDAVVLREIVRRPGPFASVYLPSPSAWASLRRKLTGAHLDGRSLTALDEAVSHSDGAGHAFVAADGEVLVDEVPNWAPPTPVARVSGLPYLLPLAQRIGANRAVAAHPSPAYDRFVSGSDHVDGLPACTEALRNHKADLLVIAVDRLGDRRVWVGGEQPDLVAADPSLRGRGVPILSWRADEALPTAALAGGAEVIVTTDPLPLADGVGVLLRS